MTASPRDVLKRSRRFDLVFKVALAHAWLEGGADQISVAEEAYLEMVRARNGFYERDPPKRTPRDFLDAFRRTFESIRARGYDTDRPPIPLNRDGELLNGAHRLAACVVCGVKCPFVDTGLPTPCGSTMEAFLKTDIHPSVVDWGRRRYLEFLPDGALAESFALTLSPDVGEAFPNWRAVADAHRSLHLVDRLKMLRYRILTLFRSGRAQEKSQGHYTEIKCRIRCHTALADFVEARRAGH